MDSDSATPAAQYFVDRSLVLSGTRADRDEVILWLSFRPSEGTVNLAVYDDMRKAYTFQFNGTTPEDVKTFIHQIETRYDTDVPAVYANTVSKFLDLKYKSFGLCERLNSSEDLIACDQCGDYGDDGIEAFYFPPLKPGKPASVAVYLHYGCYSSETFAGPAHSFDDIERAIEIIEDAIDRADNEDVEQELEAFRMRLIEEFPPLTPIAAGFGPA